MFEEGLDRTSLSDDSRSDMNDSGPTEDEKMS